MSPLLMMWTLWFWTWYGHQPMPVICTILFWALALLPVMFVFLYLNTCPLPVMLYDWTEHLSIACDVFGLIWAHVHCLWCFLIDLSTCPLPVMLFWLIWAHVHCLWCFLIDLAFCLVGSGTTPSPWEHLRRGMCSTSISSSLLSSSSIHGFLILLLSLSAGAVDLRPIQHYKKKWH